MEHTNKLLNRQQYKFCLYILNNNGYYKREATPIKFNKLPDQLTVEETRSPEIVNANHIIRSKILDDQYLLYTGLKTTKYPHWYYGEQWEQVQGKMKSSFILFNFSSDRRAIYVYYFYNLRLSSKVRNQFINNVISQVMINRNGIAV